MAYYARRNNIFRTRRSRYGRRSSRRANYYNSRSSRRIAPTVSRASKYTYNQFPPAGELKWIEENIFCDNVPDTPYYTALSTAYGPADMYSTQRPLALVAQGTTANERIGRVIHLRSFQCKLVFEATAALPKAAQCNLMLVIDMQNNGARFAPSELQTGSTNFIRSMRNLNFRDRFKVVFSKDFGVNPQGMSGSKAIIDIYKKVDMKMLYTSVNATYNECPANVMYLLISADAGDSAATKYLSVYGRTRVRYAG